VVALLASLQELHFNMSCKAYAGFHPLQLAPIEREPRLEGWLKDVTCGLDADGWFDDAHSLGNFIWTPAPAAADVVMEQMSHARHKRPEQMETVDDSQNGRIL
jgi:hypothetical protein